MNILGIDPGLVTGVAEWYDDDLWYSHEIPRGLEGFVEWWYDHESRWYEEIDIVAIENWTVRPNTHLMTPQPDPYLIIGFVQGVCHAEGRKLTKVQPASHKTLNGKGKQSKIRRLGWGSNTKDKHDEDACSLVLHTLSRFDTEAFRKLMIEMESK